MITDTVLQQRHTHLELAEMAWACGPCAVQYRQKHWLRDRDLHELRRISETARAGRHCLIINDRTDLAFELQVQGVHLGQGDGDPTAAAKLLGPEAIIGATVHSMAELEALKGLPIHYIGVGPVYGTRSKETGLPDLGLDGLAEIAAASPWPVIAIGGIEERNVPEVLRAGAHGVAILSAFCVAKNPKDVATRFLTMLDGH